ncbi:MAG: hypothetical protein HeimC2_13010 [Candidatus Heimdallarchaeota archaeon LC_2]|nr:MAG: hypothetical protein HeimC2_13010 [Candidatus Heimdallarchaeota archaeon LC_2]
MVYNLVNLLCFLWDLHQSIISQLYINYWKLELSKLNKVIKKGLIQETWSPLLIRMQ